MVPGQKIAVACAAAREPPAGQGAARRQRLRDRQTHAGGEMERRACGGNPTDPGGGHRPAARPAPAGAIGRPARAGLADARGGSIISRRHGCAGVAQLVEHDVANVVVVGSNPITRFLSTF